MNQAIRATLTLIALCHAAADSADEIFLSNGDRISGRIEVKLQDHLVITTPYAGAITVRWQAVRSLRTDAAMQVQLDDASQLVGRLKAGGGDRIVAIEGPANRAPRSLGLEKITVIARTASRKGSAGSKDEYAIHGRVQGSILANRGNTDFEHYHLAFDVRAEDSPHRFTLGGRVDQQQDGNSTTASRWIGYTKYERQQSERWYGFSNLELTHDRFQNLTLRVALGGGLGYKVWAQQERRLSLEGGVNYVYEDLSETSDRSFAAGRWGVKLAQFVIPGLAQIFHRQDGLLRLEDTRDLVVRTETGLRLVLSKGFETALQVNADWDGNPGPETGSLDLTYQVNAGYTW